MSTISISQQSYIYYPSKMRGMSKRKRKIEIKRRLNKVLSANFLGKPVNEETIKQTMKVTADFFAGFQRTYSISLKATS